VKERMRGSEKEAQPCHQTFIWYDKRPPEEINCSSAVSGGELHFLMCKETGKEK